MREETPLGPLPITSPIRRSPAEPSLVGGAPQIPFDACGETAERGAAVLAATRWEELGPRGFYARYGRRLLDLVVILALLPLAALPMLAVAVVNAFLYRDLRRVLFVQERVGYRGRRFRILKFRTMVEAPESEVDSWASGRDRLRVTPFGRFLRNTHLDEVPQLVNVLRGDMGLIGPRPEMIEIEAWAERNLPGFGRRLRIRPGITGLAQVTQGYTGCSVEAYRRKLELTERYLARLSLTADLQILLRTALWMLAGRGWGWREQGEAS